MQNQRADHVPESYQANVLVVLSLSLYNISISIFCKWHAVFSIVSQVTPSVIHRTHIVIMAVGSNQLGT